MTLRSVIAGRTMRVAFPKNLAQHTLPLLRSEIAEFEAVFGAPVEFVDRDPNAGPRWLVKQVSDAGVNSLEWDAESATLTSTVRDSAGLGSTLQMLHSLVALDMDELNDAQVDELPTAVARISQEIEQGFPGFGIRKLNWHDIRSDFPNDRDMDLESVQRLVARLQDGHTAVRQNVPVYNPPYVVELQDAEATIRSMPAWSSAALAGVQPGWKLEIADVEGWLARTGSPPHSHALVAGRRAIALNGIEQREFAASGPNGESLSWIEHAEPPSLEKLISTDVVAGDTVKIDLRNWIDGVGLKEELHRILAEHHQMKTVVLDLRGNTGGNLIMAKQVRRWFLRERTLLGSIQFTCADGSLAAPVALWEDPAEDFTWPGDLVVLTDPLTYSASEDFLHGLQGLPHVTVLGVRSGGGSGRPRTLPLVPGWSVTISTALTFDRAGNCIEGSGIPVDVPADPFTEDWRMHLGLPPA